MSKPFFWHWTLSNLFDKEQNEENGKWKWKWKKEKKENRKKRKTTRSSDPSSSPVSRQSCYNSTIYANLVFSPRIPIFLSLFSSLALSPALLAEKPFFSLRISPRISFPLLRDFYTFLWSTVYLTGKCGVARC